MREELDITLGLGIPFRAGAISEQLEIGEIVVSRDWWEEEISCAGGELSAQNAHTKPAFGVRRIRKRLQRIEALEMVLPLAMGY